ncbi:hypothetical protein AB5J55_42805 [Streptomyces sp. R11]|uniref:Uncharacterized protein n=1 Tax=Streptomyces sp. R11 TaxID=3238625 RepID=A0AB39NEE1_9ACTN
MAPTVGNVVRAQVGAAGKVGLVRGPGAVSIDPEDGVCFVKVADAMLDSGVI